MKLILSLLLLSTIAFAEQPLDVALDKSSISWKGSKVTGYHTGTVKLKTADAKMTESNLIKGDFEIDMSSIDVTDIKDPKDNAKLQSHLKSPDFFKIAAFPVSKFKITEAKPAELEGQNNYLVKGELEVLGVSNKIEFPAEVNFEGNNFTAQADVTIDRTKWNIQYGSGKFFKGLGDRLIYDDIELSINLSGQKA